MTQDYRQDSHCILQARFHVVSWPLQFSTKSSPHGSPWRATLCFPSSKVVLVCCLFAISSDCTCATLLSPVSYTSLSSSPGCPALTPGVHRSHLSQTWSLHSPSTVPRPRLCTPLCLMLVLVTWNIYEEMHVERSWVLIFIVLYC